MIFARQASHHFKAQEFRNMRTFDFFLQLLNKKLFNRTLKICSLEILIALQGGAYKDGPEISVARPLFLFCRPSYFNTYKTPKKCRPSYSGPSTYGKSVFWKSCLKKYLRGNRGMCGSCSASSAFSAESAKMENWVRSGGGQSETLPELA